MIYDYEECQKIFDILDNDFIKEIEPLGYTELEKLPIRCFKLGNGKNNIVVSASQHANEIISTTFVIYLMKYLCDNHIVFDDLSIYFIPILNPEGYIVNTSAIRSKIARDENTDSIIKYCCEYFHNYQFDLINSNMVKKHQQMFEDVNELSINPKFSVLKDSVGDILASHPKGSIIDWASNGRGIDLNSNSVNKKVIENELNRGRAYSNFRIDIPSPIGYPGLTDSSSFEQENEILALKKMFENLNVDGRLIGFLNYHSAGGVIYQRPENNDNLFNIVYNYLLSKYYQEYTIRKDKPYAIIEKYSGKVVSVNDTFRVTYPGNLLIELSSFLGNPIGVFHESENLKNTIERNIKSFIYTMENITKIFSVSKNLTNEFDVIEDIYPKIDEYYQGR